MVKEESENMKILSRKIDPSLYHAFVLVNGDGPHHIRIQAYNLDQEKKFIGMEFNRIVTRRRLNEPEPFYQADHNATFQDQLREYNKALAVAEDERAEELDIIRYLLREAYGEDADISIERICVDR